MEVLTAVIGSSALTALVSSVCTYVFNKKQRADEKQDSVALGVQMLMYHELKLLGKEYISQGFISSEDLEDYVRMHEVYHGPLEGNGFLDSLLAQVKRLPIRN